MCGYSCEYCTGTVKERVVEKEVFKHNIGFVMLENVPVGICDNCGYRYYHSTILKEWTKSLKEKVYLKERSPEVYIGSIPLDFLIGEPRIEHEYYKLLERKNKKSFYDNPEKTMEEIKKKAESEENVFVKGLWEKMYGYFKRVYEFDLVTDAVDKIPNPLQRWRKQRQYIKSQNSPIGYDRVLRRKKVTVRRTQGFVGMKTTVKRRLRLSKVNCTITNWT